QDPECPTFMAQEDPLLLPRRRHRPEPQSTRDVDDGHDAPSVLDRTEHELRVLGNSSEFLGRDDLAHELDGNRKLALTDRAQDKGSLIAGRRKPRPLPETSLGPHRVPRLSAAPRSRSTMLEEWPGRPMPRTTSVEAAPRPSATCST